MIYLEFEDRDVNQSHGVELNIGTIHEAAQLFSAFVAGVTYSTGQCNIVLTSVGTAKKRGVSYTKWSGL